jgi:phosphoglycerate dehydrogenase-like enzyme
VTVILLSYRAHAHYAAEIAAAAGEARIAAELLPMLPDPAARLSEADIARIDVAFFSEDIYPDHSRQFFSAVRKAPRLKWMHTFAAGVDHAVYVELLKRGVRLTGSSGAAAQPIAQTAIMGMLALARRLPRWLAAQRRHEWDPLRGQDRMPVDLSEQTALVVGLGRIGAGIARLARAFGLHVVGVRRGPRRSEDPVDELHPPQALPELLARADWLFLACPLTPETHGLIDAAAIARLPRGAHVINIARGKIVAEPALIAALASGHLGGAYLDVFDTEPLPADSLLWDMPNVLVSPHNATISAGNEARIRAIFLENLRRWGRGEPLLNEAASTEAVIGDR